MTGFGQASGNHGELTWTIDISSVNARGLDIRLRLPSGLEPLDPVIREAIRGSLKRGGVSVTVTTERDASSRGFRVNESGLESAIQAIDVIANKLGPVSSDKAIDPVSLLTLRGVLEAGEQAPVFDEAATEVFRLTISEAIGALREARASEGQRLATVIHSQLSKLEQLVDQVSASPERSPDAIKRRLGEAVDRLFESEPKLDPERLHQEAMVLAVKADIQEELDRLNAHIARGRELLGSDGPIGRQFDFLSQEFNREANTLCSKANHISITRIGLDAKTIIDQMREQVQNLE
ncbi:MAG: YicC/YloC family endoribonuclease [Pseudomonadota bacterium]